MRNYFPQVILACLTIGLAPFYPEPHIWGKVKWILGGAKGMAFMDWMDALMHGAPWLILIVLLLMHFFGTKQRSAHDTKG